VSIVEHRMSNSEKFALKIVTTLCAGAFFLSVAASSADTLPTAEDINSLAEMARKTTDTFVQESLELRLRYEYGGQFASQNDKENLQKIAKTASDHLLEIAKTQTQLKQQIEGYDGDDWDSRYGSAGLWRKLSSELYTTNLSKCEIDLYVALSAKQPDRDKILHRILAQTDSLNQIYDTVYSQFLKARALALLAETGSAYKTSAKKEFDALMVRSDMKHSTIFKIAVERIKLLGQTESGQLDKLAQELAQSSCADDLELILSLAFLQRRYDLQGFEKTVQTWPQTERLLGSMALSDLSRHIGREEGLRRISVFEAELAAQAAWENETGDHKILLDYLSSNEKFQTPLILYVAAVAFAETSPAKAVELLAEASNLQQLKKSDRLDVEADKIAKQAVQLAYSLFVQNSSYCATTLKAFENYSTIAGEKIDEELEYLYSIVLNNCGLASKSKELLKKIAKRPSGYWRNRARLDLIIQARQQKQYENQNQRSKVLKQLSDLISDCHLQNEDHHNILLEAIIIYCQLLLEKADKSSAQTVLNFLSEENPAWNLTLTQIKSKALRIIGRLDEAASCLAESIIIDSGSLSGEAMELLAEIVDRIDQVQEQTEEFPKMMRDCKKIAEFCYRCSRDRQSGLFLAEISIFAAAKEKGKLLEVEELLNNLAEDGADDEVDFIRCRARLLSEQGKFDEAARLWAHVAKIRKSEALSANRRSWKWWRAKFYELNCWAKRPRVQKMDVLHTIEVLENSFPDIPPLWAEKLNSLKKQCGSEAIGVSK